VLANLELSVPVSVGSANNVNKLLLIRMQLPERYKENFKQRPFVWGYCLSTGYLLNKNLSPINFILHDGQFDWLKKIHNLLKAKQNIFLALL
jgi:hypothetical protein